MTFFTFFMPFTNFLISRLRLAARTLADPANSYNQIWCCLEKNISLNLNLALSSASIISRHIAYYGEHKD